MAEPLQAPLPGPRPGQAWPPWLTVTGEDLTDTTRALALYTSLCGVGVVNLGAAWQDDDCRLWFLLLVEYALGHGRHPVALLRWLLTHAVTWDPQHLAPYADAALERLQSYYIALHTEVSHANGAVSHPALPGLAVSAVSGL